MNQPAVVAFQELVWEYYLLHGRHDLPWRLANASGFDPYKILVSELMLQQTQVGRVIPKYHLFLEQFPTVASLAAAPQAAVLTAWSGLGYNRRAVYLQRAAQAIVTDYGGIVPADSHDLERLPGVGRNTAAAILAYAFNQPVAFIETNIRSVFIHHFFADQAVVTDKDILNLVQAAVDTERPREWYWALMDYGTFLKQSHGNSAQRSTSYQRQPTFKGSKRQIRGQVIRLLTIRPHTVVELAAVIPDERLPTVLTDLLSETLIHLTADQYHL